MVVVVLVVQVLAVLVALAAIRHSVVSAWQLAALEVAIITLAVALGPVVEWRLAIKVLPVVLAVV